MPHDFFFVCIISNIYGMGTKSENNKEISILIFEKIQFYIIYHNLITLCNLLITNLITASKCQLKLGNKFYKNIPGIIFKIIF